MLNWIDCQWLHLRKIVNKKLLILLIKLYFTVYLQFLSLWLSLFLRFLRQNSVFSPFFSIFNSDSLVSLGFSLYFFCVHKPNSFSVLSIYCLDYFATVPYSARYIGPFHHFSTCLIIHGQENTCCTYKELLTKNVSPFQYAYCFNG